MFDFRFICRVFFFNVSFAIFSADQGLICCISNRGANVSMGHFKEIELGFVCIFCLRIGSKKGRTMFICILAKVVFKIIYLHIFNSMHLHRYTYLYVCIEN